MRTYTHVVHDLTPVYDEHSRILILGSLPSVKSRGQFFYNHPQNRFWKVLAAVTDHAPLENVEEKKQFLLEHQIALWDVIASCDIIGSSDSSIKNVVAKISAGFSRKHLSGRYLSMVRQRLNSIRNMFFRKPE